MYTYKSLKVAAVGIVGAAVVVCMVAPSTARACSPGQAAPPSALPRAGATGVSTATSIVVLSPTEPFGLSLLVNGQATAVYGWMALGSGVDQDLGPTRFWKVQIAASGSMLPGTADIALSLPGGDAGGTALTHFTTAAGYDKAAGTAPNLRGFQLWRVRYPVADIASGNCVFAEYQSFVTIDYAPGTVPNTPAGSVIHTFALSPMTGGATQTFVYTGATPFVGLAPAGAYPLPLAPWQPDLDPTRQYCLSVGASGDGDLAREALGSDRICASVTQLSAGSAADAGTTGSPPPADGQGIQPGGGGCSAGGGVPRGGRLWFGAPLLLLLALGRRKARDRG